MVSTHGYNVLRYQRTQHNKEQQAKVDLALQHVGTALDVQNTMARSMELLAKRVAGDS